jgi:hypothetical protein
MDPAELAKRYPRLFHMAADAAWPAIRLHGLLSTSALLDLFEIHGDQRDAIESARRPDSVDIGHQAQGQAVIRDNKPLLENRLAGCLTDGLTPAEWYRILNSRVFFWPTVARLETLLAAYRDSPQLVLVVHTDRLVAAHCDQITLSTINSGATRPIAVARGASTFTPIATFDFDGRRRRVGTANAVAEVAVDYAVPQIVDMIERVERRHPDGRTEVLWQPDD